MNDRLKIDQVKKVFYHKKSFRRAELKEFYIKFYPQLKETTFRWMLYDLKKNKVISSLERGVFTLYEKKTITLSIYQPTISQKLEDIYSKLIKQFPYLNICIWETSWLNEFMLHQPGRFFTIIEVESGTEEAVFYYLKSMFENVYVKPTYKDIELYVLEKTDSIVIKKLVSQAPISKKMHICIPKLEKILVDLFAEEDFFYFYQGQELVNIFENIFLYYKVCLPTLYRYAKRRKCNERLETFLKEKTNGTTQMRGEFI